MDDLVHARSESAALTAPRWGRWTVQVVGWTIVLILVVASFAPALAPLAAVLAMVRAGLIVALFAHAMATAPTTTAAGVAWRTCFALWPLALLTWIILGMMKANGTVIEFYRDAFWVLFAASLVFGVVDY